MPRATTAQARRLRAAPSPVEEVLWALLRGRRLEGARFRRQVPIGPYVLDFYCPAAKLCIEVDGHQHAEHAAQDHDRRRDEWLLVDRGVRVLRFSSAEVLGDAEGVRSTIFDALHPGPSGVTTLPR